MEHMTETNTPRDAGILVLIVSLIVSILAGTYFVFPDQSFNYIIVISGFVGGVILAGIFFAIGAVITRQNSLIDLLTKTKEKNETITH